MHRQAPEIWAHAQRDIVY